MVRQDTDETRKKVLDAAEAVVLRGGLGSLTLDAVAQEAGLSKGGLLHHFPSKDQLIEGMVRRSAEGWRGCYCEGYEQAPEGPGRMVRGLLAHCLSDAFQWSEELRRNTSACFAAMAQNPELIEPMREAYNELHRRVEEDGLPPGVGAAIAASIDGLWLYWALGLADVNQEMVVRVGKALERMLEISLTPEFGAGTDKN